MRQKATGGMERVGVIGLGRMGRAIARRLGETGAGGVSGWTRSGLSPAQARALGIDRAEDLRALTTRADVLILSLFDDAAVAQVLETLLSHDLSGKLIIDTSTVRPSLLPGFAPRAEAVGAALVDAPISGGPEMVADASCGVFIGGSETDATRARAVIERFSTRIVHTGPLGCGMAMKAANNAMIAGTFATLAEVLQCARGSGLDFETTLRVIAAGAVGAPFLGQRMAKILGQDDSVGFPVSGMLKDIGVLRGHAAALGVEAPVLAQAQQLLQLAADEGLSAADVGRVFAQVWDRA